MDNYNQITESDALDEHSVFSFCIDQKKHTNKFDHSPSAATMCHSITNFALSAKNHHSDTTMSTDDILSMMDFFVGAADFDSQIVPAMSLLSNFNNVESLRSINTETDAVETPNTKIVNLKKARKRLGLKFRRIRKSMPDAAKDFFKRQSDTRKSLSCLRRTTPCYDREE